MEARLIRQVSIPCRRPCASARTRFVINGSSAGRANAAEAKEREKQEGDETARGKDDCNDRRKPLTQRSASEPEG
ncbi:MULTISPECIES: hypothetical protein [Rhizobium]|uniref:Uncharacterized protein n=1 Tax=Rhizobium tropici TaxID=398 RepID=A0A6P1CBD3_RHITR|nr:MULTISPECIES: hypothetical protein [Rhizobium]AGB73034.1 hypothetical protein RTCIAT899_CH18375 [Rhizobium tropici CIAT 899]MBB5595434.1 hypothetical protein [Rhizobium tropici]NEV12815.1 hypothetical protein [Rhizobium tropici]TGE93834.1 hypothetical protein C9417_25075 [Rhizobium sp. SEMIA 4088]